MFDIITFGSATRDGFFEGIEFVEVEGREFRVGKGLCLPYGAKVDVPHVTFATGGGGINTAVTFARQGLKTMVVCRVSNDVSGEEIIRGQKKEGVNTSFTQIDKEVKTAYSVIFLTSEGERTILGYRGCAVNLSEKEIPWKKLKSKWFFIGPLSGNKTLLKMLLDYAKEHKIKVASTPGKAELETLRENPSWLNYYDVFILNQEEASFLTEIPYKKESEIFKKLDKLVNGIVVMTKGPEGVTVSDGKNLYATGTYKEKRVVDRTGAGDAFLSFRAPG